MNLLQMIVLHRHVCFSSWQPSACLKVLTAGACVMSGTVCCCRPAGSLGKVVYGVFGVGNSQWQQTYQAFPKQVALQLTAAGANQVELKT
jgi:sulfite reductase alpha subunit-like flavoprotein